MVHFLAVHRNIPTRNTILAKPSLDISLCKNKFSKKNMKAMIDEKKNKNIKGDFRITEFIEFMARMASKWLILFKDCKKKYRKCKINATNKPKTSNCLLIQPQKLRYHIKIHFKL